MAPQTAAARECAFELEGTGGKLRIQLKGMTRAGLSGISQALWETLACFLDACSCFAAAAGRRSACSPATAKGFWLLHKRLTRGRFQWWRQASGAAAYRGAKKVAIRYVKLSHGDRCPECTRGNVYVQKPKVLVRIVDQAPLAATVYELERLRCNACSQVFTAAGSTHKQTESGNADNRKRTTPKRVDNRAAGQRRMGHLCCDIGCRSLTAKL